MRQIIVLFKVKVGPSFPLHCSIHHPYNLDNSKDIPYMVKYEDITVSDSELSYFC